MLQPKEITIDDVTLWIHKFPAIEGREIICSYGVTVVPKISNYKDNETIMLKLMSYVGVKIGDNMIPLSTQALINNHIPGWETLMKFEAAVMEYNCSFFQKGLVSNFLTELTQKVPSWISKILTDSLGQLSKKSRRPSKS